jgi:hypothetical protein
MLVNKIFISYSMYSKIITTDYNVQNSLDPVIGPIERGFVAVCMDILFQHMTTLKTKEIIQNKSNAPMMGIYILWPITPYIPDY